MIETLDRYDPAALGRFDAVIDVRSPAEYAHDHAPGAISLPVLTDEERARIGAIYVQESRLKARRLGAALVARNIATHLEGPLADRSGAFASLVYCWRGGQRSHAMATVLDQVGWRVTILAGGYRTYRRWITRSLYADEPSFRVVILDGDTGSAKTEILGRLAAHGVQTLDLEAAAAHRGSLFGALPGQPQPSQKAFESRLAADLGALDPRRPVVIEAESSKLGDLTVPPTLWKAMRAAPAIRLEAPAAERARYLVSAYSDIVADRARLAAVIDRLPVQHGKVDRAAWRDLAAAGDFEALALALVTAHYDPAYARARRTAARATLAVVEAVSLTGDDLQRTAAEVARHVERA